MLFVSSRQAEKCSITPKFRARSVMWFSKRRSFGILQERRKRIFDFVLACFALVFLAPVLITIAIAIKVTSQGPILFRQERYGRFKDPFTILKFRTMRVMETGHSFNQVTRDDPRITPLGAFLRRTSLDELPQLWNVIRGDMSLVGPRPHAISMDDELSEKLNGYDQRFFMRPGITGLAQIQGYRGGTTHINDVIGRLTRDVYYVRNRTMWLDMKIIIATVWSLLTRDAY